MKITKDQVILVLAPHTDDGEFGCGGTINKLCNNGNRVYEVAFSSASETIKHGTRNDTLIDEIKKASKVLGVKPNNMFIHDFEVRKFNENRQEILDLLLYYKKTLKPDIIFLPSKNDMHQDNEVVYLEGVRAFKHQTVLSYEASWNNLSFDQEVYIGLDQKNMNKKIEAAKCFISQKRRPYMKNNYFRALALTRGVQSNNRFAELFECVRINLK